MSAGLTPNQLVASNLRRLRRERGWTQAELGAKLGWSHVSLSAAERSVAAKRIRKFDADELVFIAGAFGVGIGELFKPAPCRTCDDGPPAGFTCNTCGKG